jgi:dolichyl-phosphate beta-glucosyltransferase
MKKNNSIYLSVVIPAYNEAKRIAPTLRDVSSHLSTKDYAYEIIVVDDGSTDNTHEVVAEEMKSIPHLTFLNGQKNRGKGYAVNRGMTAAKGEYRLFMDADGSVNIREVDRFLFHAAYGFDVVIASISHPSQLRPVVEHAGYLRRIFGSVSHSIVRMFATPGIYDTQRGFKLFSAKAADIIFSRQTIDRFGFDIELLVIAAHHNLSVKEVPVSWNNPAGSTVRASDYFRTFKELFRIVNNRSAHAYD